ncbi:MAG: hypothetical protein A2X25_08490 [Chloroflexi bacterium GWB2_49_20]|nr:MAG: hypothetical protein A2X25_08490 [Chloroflexi bacterium GWB2_49_20]OGN79527.1 MAG: hypothetical protein A2X26_05535 [Chloroflexi bacterium GWC2_49_37]OGN84550.1 MAG: hypothetical protein A2X27_10995 [Chloroflexi bacterium GWD2_49_16]HBG74026.1 hypothetical protein [Anaerolineae bacterium]HCC78828.1 hypothetical protein [Anaerolineae bacterium]
MQKRSNRFWIVALVLGWLFDFLFWKQSPGINFAIYVILCLAGGLYGLRMDGIKPAARSQFLMIPIFFFAVITFVRQEPLSLFLAYALTLFLMGLLVTTFVGGRWGSFGLADYLAAYLRLTGGVLTKPFMLLNVKRQQQEETVGKPRKKNAWPVVRGILIAIPILVVFSALLSSADLVFAQRLDAFVSLFRLEKLPEYIFRVIYILIGAYLLVGVFLHAAISSHNEKLIGEEKPLVSPFLGFIESSIILGSVAILFALFVVIQFQYFFGGQANIHIDGYTYAEYARKGFGELIMVAVFSLLLFLGLSGITRRENSTQRNIFSGLGITVVVLVGIMLVSAFQRLVLYETAYGFSQLRTYTHVFMIWLGLLLSAVVVLEILRKERKFALAVLLAGIGFAGSLALLNVDGFIVRQNVERAVQGQELDAAYLASLTADSIPALVEEFNDTTLSKDIHEQIGASLACMSALAPERMDSDWRAYNLSVYNGHKMLDAHETDLKAYKISEVEYQTFVTNPSGKKMDCRGYGMMD